MAGLKQGVINWYATRGKDLTKLKDPRRMPTGVTPEQVELAAITFYNDIAKDEFDNRLLTLKSGKKLKYLGIAWEVWRIAKEIDAAQYVQSHQVLVESSNLMEQMDEKHQEFAGQAKRVEYHRDFLLGCLYAWLAREVAQWLISL